MQETRLYHEGSQQQAYERFETIRLPIPTPFPSAGIAE
jgi:hypothetical protein